LQKFVSQTEDIVLRLKEARDYAASKHKYDLSEQAFDSLDYFSILDYDIRIKRKNPINNRVCFLL